MPRRADDSDFIELTPPRGTPADAAEVTAGHPLPPDLDARPDALLLAPAPFVLPPDDPADTRGPVARLARALVLAFPLAVAAAGVGVYAALLLSADPPPPPKGKLVVLLAFDYLPGDHLQRLAPLFGPDGFERLKAEGVWYPEAEVPQAFAAAAPGFAGLVTGVPPRGHGVTDDLPAEPLTPTVGDHLKRAGGGRVVSVGLDDRALCLAGRGADAVVGFDPAAGLFRAVGRPDPPWLAELNATKPADRRLGTAWDRHRPGSLYDAVAGADSPAGKLPGAGQGVGFPHPFGPAGGPPGLARAAVAGSPAGHELAWEAAKAAIAGERLGQRGETDFLCVGLTAGGPVVRAWGPDGHEAVDLLVRADQLVGEVVQHLSGVVGRNRWAVVAAGAHGGCPLPEVAKPGRPPGERFDPEAEFGPLAAALDDVYGRVNNQPGGWVDRVSVPWVHLSRKALAERKVSPAEAAGFAAQWLGNRPAAEAAFSRAGPFPDDPLGRAVAAGFHPDRGGDVFVVHRPFAVPALAGSAWGSPHAYDRGVTLLAAGNGVPALRTRPGRVNQLVVTPILAKLLGVEPPAGAEALPAGWE